MTTEGLIQMSNLSTTEFASALETDTRTARKFLRSITPKDEQPGKGSRWVISGNKRSLTTMKKNFDNWKAAQAEKAAEAEVDEVADTENLDD